MRAKFRSMFGCLALCLTTSAFADNTPFGSLNFSRLSTPQAEFFWKRLERLAVEEAIVTYCGQPDDFAQSAEQGIRACVTSEALDKAESFFKSELKANEEGLRQRKVSCRAKPEATRGWLGIEIKPVEKDIADDPAIHVGTGALVTGTVSGSPAAEEFKAGDIVNSVNGEAVASPKDLSAKIRALAPGATVQFGILRDGATLTISAKLGAMAFDQDGRPAIDMPALVTSSEQDLKYVASEVTDMCRKCKTSIWAMFCR